MNNSLKNEKCISIKTSFWQVEKFSFQFLFQLGCLSIICVPNKYSTRFPKKFSDFTISKNQAKIDLIFQSTGSRGRAENHDILPKKEGETI